MNSEEDPIPEQSSKPQQHPVDVEDNLEDGGARDRPQSPVHHHDTTSTKLIPLKKRPIIIEGNDASSEGTPTTNVADKDGFPEETADSVRRSGGDGKNGKENSGGVEGSGKKKSRHKGKEKYGSSSKTGSSGKQRKDQDCDVEETWGPISAGCSKEKDAVAMGTARPNVADKDGFPAETAGSVRSSGGEGRKTKRESGSVGGSAKKEIRHKEEKRYASGSKTGSSGKRKAVTGSDFEVDDQEGTRMVDDDNFLDDTGVASKAEEGQEDDEIGKMFNFGKKKKNIGRDPAEIASHVKKVMAELEVAAKEDEKLNTKKEPAVNKLKKLEILTENLSKKHLQQAFLDHGVMHLLNTWLQPLPDGSKPNLILVEEILKILDNLPIDLQQDERKAQMASSGLGKTIKCLSESKEENTSIRKLAKKLVEKWCSRILNKSTNIEETRSVRPERFPSRSPSMKTPPNRGDDSHSDDFSPSLRQKSSESSSSKRAARPEPMPMDFVARPPSKINPEEVRARNKQTTPDKSRQRVDKKLDRMKKPKKKVLQATKVSAEGRGMDKYM